MLQRAAIKVLTVQSLVDVAESMCEVYPSIHNGQSDQILEKGHAEGDHELGQGKLDSREANVL